MSTAFRAEKTLQAIGLSMKNEEFKKALYESVFSLFMRGTRDIVVEDAGKVIPNDDKIIDIVTDAVFFKDNERPHLYLSTSNLLQLCRLNLSLISQTSDTNYLSFVIRRRLTAEGQGSRFVTEYKDVLGLLGLYLQ